MAKEHTENEKKDSPVRIIESLEVVDGLGDATVHLGIHYIGCSA
jgi:hypothetical protein